MLVLVTLRPVCDARNLWGPLGAAKALEKVIDLLD
jgi:hypothetical protein